MPKAEKHPLARLRDRAGITQPQLGYAISPPDARERTHYFASRVNAYEIGGKRIPLEIAIEIVKVFARGWIEEPPPLGHTGTGWKGKRLKFKKLRVRVEDLIDTR